jgi:nucleotide-binding universal stress UspA family protein
MSSEAAATTAPAEPRVAPQGRPGLLPRPDTGSILVAVDGYRGWDALEWAAAEAAARRCALRVVHVTKWPIVMVDLFTGLSVHWRDPEDREAAALVVKEAARRARSVAPALEITTYLPSGRAAAAILREGREDALIVVGRGREAGRFRSFTGSMSWRVARHANCPVAMIELLAEASGGPSAGRVVVGIDSTRESTAAVGFAFRAARRRGVGITALVADSVGCAVEDALRTWQGSFPDVDVRQRLVAAPMGAALVTESTAAALVIVGARPRGRLHRALVGTAGPTVLRSAHSPVVIVRTPGH